MSTALRTRRLLRECIRVMLAEDTGYGGDYGGLGMGDAMGGMAYGAHFGTNQQLYNIFIKPFTDVVVTAAGKTKEMSQRAQTVLKVAFESLATVLVPWLSNDYNRIFAKEKQEIDRIRSEYSDVYKSTWDSFQNSDMLIAAFAYRPDLFLTTAFAKKAPKATARLLSVLSGGTLDKALGELLKGDVGGKGTGSTSAHGPISDGRLWEDDTEGNVNEPSALERLVSNKKVKALLASSPKVQQLTQVGQHLVQGTLRDVFGHAQNVLAAKSLDDLQRKLGKKVPGLDKLAEVPEAERQQAEQQLLAGVKKGMKLLYVKNLEGQVKAAVKAGVPQDHPFVHDYIRVISRIKAL